jgi:pyridinium-3,5-biscarboxylic acid mononucleotide synthase
LDRRRIESLLRDLRDGKTTVAVAVEALRDLPYEDLEFAKIDSHREIRRGHPEAIYCPGKTPQQILTIAQRMVASGSVVLATRATPEVYESLRRGLLKTPIEYVEKARLVIAGVRPKARRGSVLVVTAGTSDIPVAEEAAVTAEVQGSRVTRLYDVGVAGVHRVLDRRDLLREARVIVVVAGMEGALPSVVAGLVDVPVIAVPTSVGYGASFDGLAALLGMMNSCAPGVAVVNIDNGFGAGYLASVINAKR